MEVWYDQKEFDSWFATLRSNRRMKSIMPLLHEISSDEDEPGEDGEGSKKVGPSTKLKAIKGPDASDNTSTVPEGDEASGNKEGEGSSSTGTSDRTFKVIVSDIGGFTYGSYDTKFPFVSLPKNNPINPFAYVSSVARSDFDAVKMNDPRKEDINTLIAIAARGIRDVNLRHKILDLEDEVEDPLLPSLTKCATRKATTSMLGIASPVAKRPILKAAPHLTYDKSGWVGRKTPIYSSGRRSKRLRIKTRSLVESPLLMANLPLYTRRSAIKGSMRLVKRSIRK